MVNVATKAFDAAKYVRSQSEQQELLADAFASGTPAT